MEWIPFELHPGTPAEGIVLAERFGEKEFLSRLNDLRIRGVRFGCKYAGLERMANSHNALIALHHAVQCQRGDAFRTAVYHAYYEEGRNIGQLEVLLELGEQAGLERTALESFLRKADNELFNLPLQMIEKFKVQSVPTFVVADQFKVVGSDQEEALIKAIEMAMKE